MTNGFMLVRKLLHLLPPETVHRLGIAALKGGLLPSAPVVSHPSLAVQAFGLHFPNPIGLAAGFDKNAEAVAPLLRQGFGFVEAGTVTPLAQPGNPKPRIFRLSENEAVINRLGFNNQGLSYFTEKLKARDRSIGIVGANIGKNKDSADAAADYVRGLEAVYPHADYITVNISSPNTPGLRALQSHEALGALLGALMAAREKCRQVHERSVPLLLKVAPDLGAKEREDIAQLALAHAIDGLIVSNTTIARPPTLKGRHSGEQGGLSGRPLFAPSTDALRDFYRLTGGKLKLVGVGGVSSAEEAYAKIRAGATLVQLYTALVYRGFGMIGDINRTLPELLRRDGFSNVAQAVGADAK